MLALETYQINLFYSYATFIQRENMIDTSQNNGKDLFHIYRNDTLFRR